MINRYDIEELESRNDRRTALLSNFRAKNPDQDWPRPQDLLLCHDCRKGKAYHSSRHPNEVGVPVFKKERVYLSEEQKQEILVLSKNGAAPKDLAKQFKTTRENVYKLLKVGNLK